MTVPNLSAKGKGTMNFDAVKKAAENYEKDMTKFLRDLIAIPSESAEEEGVSKRILSEMESLGFDECFIDPQGNVHGYMGKGEKIIAFDGHIDTVGLGEISNWKFDPYKGYENETEIGGRGSSDQTGGVVSAVYGAKIMKDLGLIPEGFKVLVTGSVQEEDCDGLCWQYIHNELNITPEFVVITEPTDKGIYRGHRGRMEIRVEVKGISCHGSAPERGDNAIYKMAEIVLDVKKLNERLHFDPFLGKGTVTVTQQFYTSPSRCAVADFAAISLDRSTTQRSVCIPMSVRHGRGLFIPPSATSLHGSSPRIIPRARRSSLPTRVCTASPELINGPSRPMRFLLWVATASPASASVPERKRRRTRPTRSHGKKIWSAARLSMPPSPSVTRRRTEYEQKSGACREIKTA